jgi:hypothetical protein
MEYDLTNRISRQQHNKKRDTRLQQCDFYHIRIWTTASQIQLFLNNKVTTNYCKLYVHLIFQVKSKIFYKSVILVDYSE